MAGPPSLPTPYGGVVFRSRTEARYAVMFDELGIRWDYETQGFDADGTWYLPDFVLFPALGMLWAEIKGSWEQDPEGIARWRKFSLWRPMPSRAVLLVGTPAVRMTPLVMGGDPDVDPWEDDTREWRPCPAGQHFDLVFPGLFRGKFAEDGCDYSDQEGRGEAKLERAISTARTARFARAA